ncbi:MAG: hypothetical protein ABSA46_04565 [Thermodesulfovibrionales bacterium]
MKLMVFVMLQGGESCKDCGTGEIGFRMASGNMSMFTVWNMLDGAKCRGRLIRHLGI